MSITKVPDAAETLLSDAIEKSVRMFDVAKGAKFMAYLKTVLRNSAFDWVRRYKKQQKYLELHREMSTRSAFAEAISKEAVEFFGQVVSKLNKRMRRAIILRVIDGLSFREIGKKMRTSEINARNIFHRAKEQLWKWTDYMEAL